MYVHRSNRMEGLVDELAAVLQKPRLPVLAPETILIQSQGMERWLSRELAARLGGFCNARFPFPRAFIRQAIDAVLGPAPQAALYEREVMMWAIAALLVEQAWHKAFAPVTNYLGDDPGGIRRLQLSERIAYLYDQYVIYRPKLVLDWEAGRGTDWQALLWRSMTERYDRLEGTRENEAEPAGRAHFAARAADFERRFSPLFVERGALPARLCIVGGASLPPLFLRLLAKLGECIEVHMFCLAPSREYLGHAATGAGLLAWSADETDVHPLLASLGQVGAAFQHVLESEVSYVDGAGEFVDPPSDTVLHALQSDLLNNRQRAAGREPRLPRPSLEQDDSISLVSCHSPMREVEVLRDRLLALFDADPTLRPDDIVVMAARIEEYVPLIEAVFSGDPREPDTIPFRIADRSELRENAAAEGLLQLLRVLEGRLKASEVLDLLQFEPVRARFGIEAADLPTVYRWVHESGIRWGEDAAHRQQFGLPQEAANSWRFGLDRLLLGCALGDDQRTCFAGTVPYDPGGTEEVELLGRFVEFCETLFQARRLTTGQQNVARWCEILREVSEAFLADDGGKGWQLRPVYAALHAIEESARSAEFVEPLALEVMVAQLLQRFEEDKSSTEFVAGGVTFCAMLPLRSIPFRVVCLLGMNDGEFPRIEQQLGFDKMAERPQVGDRSQRAEDRYLFLETILSARERLIISHVGRGIQDNQQRPPTVVVAELSAAIEGLLEPPRAGQPEYLAPAQHPLQPFSPRAFDGRDSRLASYSETYAVGAVALEEGQHAIAPLFSAQALTAFLEEEAALEPIDLEDLVAFFKSPARALLRKLGLSLEEDIRLVEDREAVESDALVRYVVGSRLVAAAEGDLADHVRVEVGRGALPFGAPGRVLLEKLGETAGRLRRAATSLTAQGPYPALPIALRSKPDSLESPAREVEVVGVLEGLYRASVESPGSDPGVRLVTSSYAQLSPKYELAAWIRHLAAQAAGAPVVETVVLGRTQDNAVVVRRFGALAGPRARELLADLVALYRMGHTRPLPFFPALSRAFVERVRKAPGDREAERRALIMAARDLSDPKDWGVQEGADVHVQWAFRGRDPMGLSGEPVGADPTPTFADASLRVFGPLLEEAEEISPISGEETE